MFFDICHLAINFDDNVQEFAEKKAREKVYI